MAESILPRDHWPLDSAVLFFQSGEFLPLLACGRVITFLLQLLGYCCFTKRGRASELIGLLLAQVPSAAWPFPSAILASFHCNLSLVVGSSRSSFLSSALAARGGRRKFRTGASSPAPCLRLARRRVMPWCCAFSGAGRGPRAKVQVEGIVSLRYIRGSTGLCFRPSPCSPSGGRQNAGRSAVCAYREPPCLGRPRPAQFFL